MEKEREQRLNAVGETVGVVKGLLRVITASCEGVATGNLGADGDWAWGIERLCLHIGNLLTLAEKYGIEADKVDYMFNGDDFPKILRLADACDGLDLTAILASVDADAGEVQP